MELHQEMFETLGVLPMLKPVTCFNSDLDLCCSCVCDVYLALLTLPVGFIIHLGVDIFRCTRVPKPGDETAVSLAAISTCLCDVYVAACLVADFSSPCNDIHEQVSPPAAYSSPQSAPC